MLSGPCSFTALSMVGGNVWLTLIYVIPTQIGKTMPEWIEGNNVSRAKRNQGWNDHLHFLFEVSDSFLWQTTQVVSLGTLGMRKVSIQYTGHYRVITLHMQWNDEQRNCYIMYKMLLQLVLLSS